MTILRAPCIPITACLLAPLVSAQTVWNVPDMADVTPYVAQASPGDVLVLGANHFAFALTKGLTLRPASGRTTITAGGPSPITMAITVPAGQVASLRGIDFASVTGPFLQGGQVTANGTVHFEDCTFRAEGMTTFVAQAGSVVLRDCNVTGGYQSVAMLVQGGRCSIVDCTLQGSGTSWGIYSTQPRDGMQITGGTVLVSHSTVRAGASGTYGGYSLGPATGIVVGGGTLFLTDSLARGGDPPGGIPPNPGASAVAASGGAVHYARCTLQPGSGAPTTVGNAANVAALVGITTTGDMQLGTTFTATVKTGSSAQWLGLAYWFDLAPNQPPELIEPLWGAVLTGAIGPWTVPAAGATVPFPIVIPAVPALRDRALWLQALQLDLPVVRGSAVVGGRMF